MTTCSVFIAVSLDGFIARRDGRIDWLDRANAVVTPGEDCGFRAFLDSVDVLVMGRATWELVRGFPEWPYGATPVVVLSSRPVDIPESLRATVRHDGGEPRDIVERLSRDGLDRAYVDGGTTIQRCMRAGLVDDLVVTIIPVLLGEGLPLFGPTGRDVALVLEDVRRWDFGFAQLRYRVQRA
jgi:dihydrofolate reductase